MKKKQKHPRLPSGFGSIRYLGEKRSRPYQVRAAAHMEGDQIVPGDILTYTDDWYKGFALLTAYNAHTWRPGDDVEDLFIDASEGIEGLVERLIDDYARISGKRYEMASKTTLRDVIDLWYKDKYERNEKRVFSENTKTNVKNGIRSLGLILDRPFSMLRLSELQAAIDSIPHPTTQPQALAVLHGVYKYAIAHEIVDKDYSAGIVVDAHESKHGGPFTPAEIKKLWKLRDDPIAEMLLIMIYSGFRISAYETMTVNLEERYFQGGVKTAASKNRIVPIHHMILPLVRKRLQRCGYLIRDAGHYGPAISEWCRAHGMDHTPHHTRHTFSALCEKYQVNENDRKRLLGHAFRDVTNSVYGHRSIDDLRMEIEKIPTCDNL